MSGDARARGGAAHRGQVPRPHRGDVRRDRAALRPPEPAAERRHRPAMAGAGGRSLALTGRETLVDVCAGTADVALEAVRRAVAAARRARSAWTSPARCWRSALGKVRGARPVAARRRWCGATRCGCRSPRHRPTRPPSPSASATCTIPRPACAELARVLRPGGRLAILEFGVPRVPGLSGLYRWYFSAVLPRVGRAHLRTHRPPIRICPPRSAPSRRRPSSCAMLEQAGFDDVRADPLTLGIVYLYSARRR